MTMKLGVLSDVHGNLAALETALEFLDEEGVQDILCCGDVVGYGPRPNACVDLVQAGCGCCVSGNHDAAAIGTIEVAQFNGNAGVALRWTQTQLTPEAVAFLKARPLKTSYEGFFVTHGSPRDPIWEYVTDRWGAYANFHHFDERICWFGHSHVPTLFAYNGGEVVGGLLRVGDGHTAELDPNERYLINPGSVGQPRDGDWRLSLAVYARDDRGETVTFHRVEYDVARTQRQLQEANLPAPLYNRLHVGR